MWLLGALSLTVDYSMEVTLNQFTLIDDGGMWWVRCYSYGHWISGILCSGKQALEHAKRLVSEGYEPMNDSTVVRIGQLSEEVSRG